MKFLKLWIIGALFAFFSSVSSAVALHDAVQTTANLNTRATPSATGGLIATMPSGSTGTIDNGPTAADGYTWWYVRWSGGQSGWSIQDYLATITPNLLIYTDSLGYGWSVYPWANTSINILSGTHQYGTNGIQVTTSAAWARMYLKTNGFNTSGYQTLRFSVNGGSLAGQNLYVGLYTTGGSVLQYVNISAYVNGGNLSPNTWYDVAIPLSEISASGQVIGGFVVEAAQAMTFYVDQAWFSTALDSTKWIPPASTITGVSVSCSPSSIQTNQTSQCTAAVSGTGSYSSAVAWTADAGSVNSAGLFTAGSANALVTATSIQNSTKSGSANVTVTTPPPPTMSQAGAIVYGETAGWGWYHSGWSNTVSDIASPTSFTGDFGIETKTSAQWGRLQLLASSNFKFNTVSFNTLSFALNIGKYEGEDLWVGLVDSSGSVPPGSYKNIKDYTGSHTLDAYQWQPVSVPLSVLGATNADVYGVEIQSTNPATFYVDAIQFETNGGMCNVQ